MAGATHGGGIPSRTAASKQGARSRQRRSPDTATGSQPRPLSAGGGLGAAYAAGPALGLGRPTQPDAGARAVGRPEPREAGAQPALEDPASPASNQADASAPNHARQRAADQRGEPAANEVVGLTPGSRAPGPALEGDAADGGLRLLAVGTDAAAAAPPAAAGDAVAQAGTGVENQPENPVLDRELADVTADAGIEAERKPGQPIVLAPPAGDIAAQRQMEPGPAVPKAGGAKARPEASAATAGAGAPADAESALSGTLDALTGQAAQTAAGEDAAAESETEEGEDDAGADGHAQAAAAGGQLAAAPSAEVPAAAGPGAGLAPGEGAAVPAPQPEALRASVPERPLTQDEFLEVFESESSPERDLAEARAMLAGLRADAEADKASILAEAQARKDAVLSAAAAQAEAVRAAAASAIAEVRASFTTARGTLTADTAARKTELSAQIAAQVAQLEAASAAKVLAADSQLTARQLRIAESAEAERARPVEIAEAEAARAQGELESAAVECETAGEAEAAKHRGSDESNPDKRAAAREVGRDSAADIRAKKAPLAEDIRSRADGEAARYAEYADGVSAQIEQARADLLPTLEQYAVEAVASLQASEAGVAASLDQRLDADLAALDTAEASSVDQLESARSASLAEINAEAGQSCRSIDNQAQILTDNIDASVTETEAVVFDSGEVFLPGVRDVVAGTRAALMTASAEGLAALAASARASIDALAAASGNFRGQAQRLAADAAVGARDIVDAAGAAAGGILQRQAEQGALAAEDLSTRQDGLVAPVMEQIDAAIYEAESAMRDITARFAEELRSGVDESIEKAILPRTDDVGTRAAEAASEVDDAWYEGFLRAVGQIVVGLVILVVVALVVAAVAAAFGVILTAWTAIMVAGAILLAVGFVLALSARAGQAEMAGAPWYEVAGIALLDTVGYTGVHESISGHDFVTDRALTPGQRTERGVMGAVTMISLALGVRAAFKGPPGGAYVRPSSLPKGLFGWRSGGGGGFLGLRNAFAQMGRGMRAVGIEMWAGTKGGIRSAVEWVRTRLLGMEPTRPSPELLAQVGEPSTAETLRGSEVPYRHPPEMVVAERGKPIDVSTLDPNKTYLWVVDGEGRVIIAPERQSGFGRWVKHGDLVPGAGGEFRGQARAGGELRARWNDTTGEWVWEMDSNSSYSFARTDKGTLGEPSRAAAHEVLSETGTDTGSIDVLKGDRYPHAPAPPRPGAAPVVPPAHLPPDTATEPAEEPAAPQ
jgi:hypothetical protein